MERDQKMLKKLLTRRREYQTVIIWKPSLLIKRLSMCATYIGDRFLSESIRRRSHEAPRTSQKVSPRRVRRRSVGMVHFL